MLGITSCFLGRHSKPMLLETNLKVNVTFNEHALTIRVCAGRRIITSLRPIMRSFQVFKNTIVNIQANLDLLIN